MTQALEREFDFPYFYGRNWDAFWDAVTGLVEIPDHGGTPCEARGPPRKMRRKPRTRQRCRPAGALRRSSRAAGASGHADHHTRQKQRACSAPSANARLPQKPCHAVSRGLVVSWSRGLARTVTDLR
ncbi:barstar family protein [Streptomyces sp. NPDC006692]|uniref:barstar family protein n=1 Tax=Streptomyces sp. NPDC006692 TaxID=3364758 RepID=UPI0036A61E6B